MPSQLMRSKLPGRLCARWYRAALRGGLLVVLPVSLLGCATPARLSDSLAVATPAARPPTKAEYLQRLCGALTDFQLRHRAWHTARHDVDPVEEHWNAAFVPTVHDPVLPVFDDPPPEDRLKIATMRETFEAVSGKFAEAGQKGRTGDRAGAEAIENEGFELFSKFGDMLTEYGFNEQTCPG